jgi:hypothetical protein
MRIILALGVIFTQGDLLSTESVQSHFPPFDNIDAAGQLLSEMNFPRWYLHANVSLDDPIVVQNMDRVNLAESFPHREYTVMVS